MLIHKEFGGKSMVNQTEADIGGYFCWFGINQNMLCLLYDPNFLLFLKNSYFLQFHNHHFLHFKNIAIIAIFLTRNERQVTPTIFLMVLVSRWNILYCDLDNFCVLFPVQWLANSVFSERRFISKCLSFFSHVYKKTRCRPLEKNLHSSHVQYLCRKKTFIGKKLDTMP